MKFKHEILNEYEADSPMESYTGIVLDKEKNAFKVLSGMFHDKKDFYEKMSKRDLILRKCFESKVWDWIVQNAPDPFTGYLMFSTAFSKWRGNNILSDYYIKLLNDIPQLNREARKGDPNSMGKQKSGWYESKLMESILKEYFDDEFLDNYNQKRIDNGALKNTVYVYPVTYAGEIDKSKPSSYTAYIFPEAEGKLRFRDPRFLRDVWYNIKTGVYGKEPYPAYAFYLNDTMTDPTIFTTQEIDKTYGTTVANKNPAYTDIPNKKPITVMMDRIRKLKSQLKAAKEKGDRKTYEKLLAVYDDAKAQYTKELEDQRLDFTPEEAQEIKKLKQKIWNTNANSKKLGYSPEEVREIQAKYNRRIKQIEDKARARKQFRLNTGYSDASLDYSIDNLRDQLVNVNNPVPTHPIHNGQTEEPFLNALDRKHNLENKLNKLLLKKNSGEPVKLKEPGKQKSNNSRFSPYSLVISAFRDEHKDEEDIVSTAIGNTNKQIMRDNNIPMDEVIDYVNNNVMEFSKKLQAEYNNLKKNGKDTKEAVEYVNAGAPEMYLAQTAQDTSLYNGTFPISSIGRITEEKTHGELNPDLFEGKKLKKDVKDSLLNIANKFQEYLELPIAPVDIYFTGSSANYNYNPQSDIDLHLVYDFENSGINAEMLKKYLQAAKKVFNSNYKITIKGIPVELGAENLNEPLVTTAVYSVLKDEWKKEPNNAEVEMNEPEQACFNDVTNTIEKAIQSKDSTIMSKLWKGLGKLRKDSLAKEGEFGSGNALFKKLRNMGYLNRLKDAYYNSASKELSLEALEDIE